MMSSTAVGSILARRRTSGRTVVIRVSGAVLASVPLNDRPIAVLVAATMTGVGMFVTSEAVGLRSCSITVPGDTVKVSVDGRGPLPGSLCLGFGNVEMLIAQPEGLFGAELGSRLDEVKLAQRELQVRAERVEQVASDFLTLVRLALLDQTERLFRDHH